MQHLKPWKLVPDRDKSERFERAFPSRHSLLAEGRLRHVSLPLWRCRAFENPVAWCMAAHADMREGAGTAFGAGSGLEPIADRLALASVKLDYQPFLSSAVIEPCPIRVIGVLASFLVGLAFSP